MQYYDAQKFNQENYNNSIENGAEFENCSFTNININGSNCKGVVFRDCTFTNCDLSNVKLFKSTFQNVSFVNSKLLGLRFEDCNTFLFAIHGISSVFNFSVFHGINLKASSFKNCDMSECDFSESVMSGIDLTGTNFENAIFDNTNLVGADFRNAKNYRIDPRKNSIKKAIFSADGLAGLLYDLDIVIK